MACKSCGEPVARYGCYCSRCGKRLRTDEEDNYLALKRTGRQFVNNAILSGNSTAVHVAADCAWRMAIQLWQKRNKTFIGDKNCPPRAKFEVEKEASCILRLLEAEIYRAEIN